jgi:glycosyltransferase involved in cell wall biosynthesis
VRLLRGGSRHDGAADEIRTGFDADFYRRAYPEVTGTDEELLRDYLSHGWLSGRDPSADFSTIDYLESNGDVRAAGVNPLLHYVRDGRKEGRRPRRSRTLDESRSDIHGTPAYRGLVDPAFYRAWYPDADALGVDPAEHLHGWGWHEGRDPSPWFDSRFYRWANADVVPPGADPFAHFLAAGRRGGRRPRDPLTFDRQTFLASPPPGGQRPAERLSPDTHPTRGQTPAHVRTTDDPVVLAVLNRDHRRHGGGVEACTAHEESALVAAGRQYVALVPAEADQRLADSASRVLCVLRNGEEVARLPAADLVGGLKDLLGAARVERVAVHGLLGHHPESLAAACAGLPTDYWVHDFYAVCENPALARSGLEFCGAPPPSSTACRVCLYGTAREQHVARMSAFLDVTNASVVAPSATAADLWATMAQRDRSAIAVLPHGRLQLGPAVRRRAAGRPPRLAFVGAPVHTKGWDDFVEVARWAASRGDLATLHIGQQAAGHPAIADVPMSGGGLTDALVEHDVDAVMLWSTVPETFSLVAHEAMAAGCLIVTGPASGNLVAVADEHDRALVYPDRHHLRRAAVTGGLARAITDRTAAGLLRGAFVMDGLTPRRLGLT